MKGLQNFNALQSQEMEWVVGGGGSFSKRTELEEFDHREFCRKMACGPPLTQGQRDFEAERVAVRERLKNRIERDEVNQWHRQANPGAMGRFE